MNDKKRTQAIASGPEGRIGSQIDRKDTGNLADLAFGQKLDLAAHHQKSRPRASSEVSPSHLKAVSLGPSGPSPGGITAGAERFVP